MKKSGRIRSTGRSLGRAAWPSDFAPLARFLVGPGARYITGQTINVNGGTYFGV